MECCLVLLTPGRKLNLEILISFTFGFSTKASFGLDVADYKNYFAAQSQTFRIFRFRILIYN